MPKWVARTAAKHLRRPARVEVDAGMLSPPLVEHLVYSIEKSDKIEPCERCWMDETVTRLSSLPGLSAASNSWQDSSIPWSTQSEHFKEI